MRGQFPQLDITENGGDWFKDMAVERDRLCGPAVQALRKPVVHGPLNCIASLRLRAGVVLGLELAQLRGHLGACAARYLVPTPGLSIRPVAD